MQDEPLHPPLFGCSSTLIRPSNSSILSGHELQRFFTREGRAWSDEKWDVLGNFAVDDSAIFVARRYCDGGRRNDPPWPPLLKGGKLCATHAEGNLRSSIWNFSTVQGEPARPRWEFAGIVPSSRGCSSPPPAPQASLSLLLENS